MPTLVVNIGAMPRQLTLNKVEVACSLQDELRYSSWIGHTALIVREPMEGGARSAFATAVLSHFASSEMGSVAVLTNLQPVLSEQPMPAIVADHVFALLPDAHSFTQPDENQGYWQAEEAGTPFYPLEIYGQIAQQVRMEAHAICAYSGSPVQAGEGSATPIQPTSLGGRVHIRNFIFLHDEPAQLFNRFAWTIGPDLEIIADAYAMSTELLSTLNPTGKILVSDDPSQHPDERALAWHREQFMQRLR